MKTTTNPELAALLRKMAAAYTILGENRFKIIAYDKAADSIEHLTSEAKDLWDQGKLAEIPGVGRTIAGHLDELFETGKTVHFEETFARVPEAVFPLLSVPGIGPKRAFKLVTALGLASGKTAVRDLAAACDSGQVAAIPTFGVKSAADLRAAITLYCRGSVKENRLLLSEADLIAGEILQYIKRAPGVVRADVLGSLRRRVATIGDIDIAVATNDPEPVLEHFLRYSRQKLIERGPKGASVILANGRQVDLRVCDPASYGSMLQYFTGSKNHNIALRTFALNRGLSLSEYGIKDRRTAKLKTYEDEAEFYRALGLPLIPPELREDTGEIETAVKSGLPELIEMDDIRGDLHLHTDYNLEPSHDLGQDSLETYLKIAEKKRYQYLGINDHNPSMSGHTKNRIISIMKARRDYYEQISCAYSKKSNKNIRVLIMCEVDITPEGALALPDKAFDYVDGVIASVHSSFQMEREQITSRVVRALRAHPKVRILGHPTGRLLTKREGMDLDFQEIFRVVKENNQALEINCHPMRLDLPDELVRDAVRQKVKLVLGTDSHDASGLDNLTYGISVARRGWAVKGDILNSLPYNKFAKWLLNA